MKENATLPVSEIDDLDEVQPLTEEDFKHAVHRVGLKPVGKKLKINIMLDPDVVAWYKARAGGEDTRH
ncbi:MAG: BrnA antitoxin family protein [Oxalobacter formigenes]|nr:BrnA antitoxin family protein [Oxalobacter formigenes]